jgi:RimJ/RimL family protein N-acetyltransferase
VHIFLTTERLVLRRFTEADADNLFDLDGDPEVMRFLTGGKPTPRDVIENLPRFLRYHKHPEGFGFWAATEGSTGAFLGWCAFHPQEGCGSDNVELGYRLAKSSWGRGYATEGSHALHHKGFTGLGVRRVFAQTMAINTASRRVMEKAGLVYVRTFHEDWQDPIEGAVEYTLIRADWERQTSFPTRRPTSLPPGAETG